MVHLKPESSSSVARKKRVPRSAKGFGHNWAQLPTPCAETCSNDTSNTTTLSHTSSVLMEVNNRMDTVPLPGPVARQWKSRVETYTHHVQISHNILPLLLQPLDLMDSMGRATYEGISGVPTQETSCMKPGRVIKMYGQYLPDGQGLHDFEWMDHDAIVPPEEMDFEALHRARALLEENDKDIDQYFSWKSRINEADKKALHYLIEQWEQRFKQKPPLTDHKHTEKGDISEPLKKKIRTFTKKYVR